MRIKIISIIRLFFTLKGVGFKRILYRVLYECKKTIGKKIPNLILNQLINRKKNLSLESYMHLSPIFNFPSKYNGLNFITFSNEEKIILKKDELQGYYAKGFGLKELRKTIKLSSNLNTGIYALFTIISNIHFKKENILDIKNNNKKGKLKLANFGTICWDLTKDSYLIK